HGVVLLGQLLLTSEQLFAGRGPLVAGHNRGMGYRAHGKLLGGFGTELDRYNLADRRDEESTTWLVISRGIWRATFFTFFQKPTRKRALSVFYFAHPLKKWTYVLLQPKMRP